jgi:hypothetical protein
VRSDMDRLRLSPPIRTDTAYIDRSHEIHPSHVDRSATCLDERERWLQVVRRGRTHIHCGQCIPHTRCEPCSPPIVRAVNQTGCRRSWHPGIDYAAHHRRHRLQVPLSWSCDPDMQSPGAGRTHRGVVGTVRKLVKFVHQVYTLQVRDVRIRTPPKIRPRRWRSVLRTAGNSTRQVPVPLVLSSR